MNKLLNGKKSLGAVALDLVLNSAGFEKSVKSVISDTANSMKSAFGSGSDITKTMQSAFGKGTEALEKMSKSSNSTASSIGQNLLPKVQSIAPAFSKVAGAVGSVASGVGIVIGVITGLLDVVKKIDATADKILNRFHQGVQEVIGGMKKVMDFIKKLTGKSNDFENSWSTSLRNIGYLMISVFGIRQLYEFGKTSVQVASETQAAWVGLSSIVNSQGKSFKASQKFIEEYVSDGLVPLNNAVTGYKNLISAGYTEDQAQEMMVRLKDAAAFGRQAHLTLGDAVTTATEGIKNQNSTLTDNAGVTKNLSVMYADYAATIGKGSGSLNEAEKRTAIYNGILKETQHQVGDAEKATQTFSGKVARLSSAFTSLKTAVGNVVIPIIELFIPTIQRATEAMTRFFEMISNIMAQFGLKMKSAEELMSGSIGNVGGSAVDTAGDIASTGDAAEKAAKKINNAFNSVDEINVLDTSSNATGSGDGSGIDDPERLENPLLGKGDETSNILDGITKTAFEYGQMFADKLNSALEKIDWDKIKNGAKNIATNIANFLNGFIDEADWFLIGGTIGDGINTALTFANTFLETFDWKKWGSSLATSINGAFNTIDWKLLGKTIANYFNMSIDTFAGFVKTLDWAGVGLSIANALNSLVKNIHWDNLAQGMIDGITGIASTLIMFVRTTNWKELGDSIINTLNKAIKGIDWERTGKAVGDAIAEVMKLIRRLLTEVDWSKVIKEFLNGIDLDEIIIEYVKIKLELAKMKWTAVWEILLETIEAGLVYIGEQGWKTLSDWANEYFIEPIKKIFNSESVLELGANLIEGLFKGILGAMTSVYTFVKAFITDTIIGAVKFLFGINSPSKVFAEIGGYLIEGLWKGIGDKKTWFVNKWKEVKGWFTNITATASLKITTTKEWVKQKWNELTSNWKDKTVSLKAKIGTVWNDLKTKWNSLMSNFKDKTITIKTKIGEVVGNIKSTINNSIIKPINNKLPKIFPKIPYLAQGGWFAANNPQLAVVGDNKREPEIVAPESKIEDAVMRGLAKSGNAGANNKLELEILVKYEDGRRIIKKINDYQISQGKVLLMT